MLRVINYNKLISYLAQDLAYLQNSADYWYYILEDDEMSSHMLDYVTELKNIANDLEILDQVWNQALNIYDFSNSGKQHYEPDIDYIQEIHDMFEDYNKTRIIF